MKNLFMLSVISLTAIFSYAQSHKFETGILGGINIINPGENVVATYQNKAAYGLSFQHNLMKRFSINYSAVFYSYGYNYNEVLPCNSGGTCWIVSVTEGTNNFVMIPVMAKWSFGQKAKVFASVGAQMMMFYNGKGTTTYQANQVVENKYDRKRFDGSLIAGLGGSYPVTNSLSVSLEGRISAYYFEEWSNMYGSNTQVLLGLNYRFGAL